VTISALLSLLTTMSATPTTSVLRGGAITHLPVGSINQSAFPGARPAKPVKSTVKVAIHGTSI
jgi:hypothetical protein